MKQYSEAWTINLMPKVWDNFSEICVLVILGYAISSQNKTSNKFGTNRVLSFFNKYMFLHMLPEKHLCGLWAFYTWILLKISSFLCINRFNSTKSRSVGQLMLCYYPLYTKLFFTIILNYFQWSLPCSSDHNEYFFSF